MAYQLIKIRDDAIRRYQLIKTHDNAKRRDFDALSWSVLFRFVVSPAAGFGLALLLYAVFWVIALTPLIEENPVTLYIWSLTGALLTTFFLSTSQKEGKPDELVVPETKFAAQLLWLGITLTWYLRTSRYPWIGTNLGFSVSKKVAEPFTDKDGFFKMGDIQFRVWNVSTAIEGSDERTYVSAPAKNEAEIRGALTLIVRIKKPWKVLDSDQPAIDLGDRARQEFREFTARFVDTDIPKLHSVLGEVFKGRELVTSFIGESVAGHKAGSMVVDTSGEAIFELIGDNETEEEAKEKLIKRIMENGNVRMRKAASREVEVEGQKVIVVSTSIIKVQNPIKEVLDAIGCTLERVTFADIEFAPEVQEAANKASAEQNERIAQLASARTIKAVRKELLPSAEEIDNPGSELATILAAAQDDKTGNIQVIMIPGGDSLTKAAIAGAKQIGGN